jgi:hypothetical protein
MKLLHIVRKPPGKLFDQVVGSQGRGHEITIVLFPEVDTHGRTLPGQVLELGLGGQGKGALRGHPEIGYAELLELIFQQDRVFCW